MARKKSRLLTPDWVWHRLHLYQHLGAVRQGGGGGGGGSLVTHSKECGIHTGRATADRIVKWWWEVRQLKEVDRRAELSIRWNAGGTRHGSQCPQS